MGADSGFKLRGSLDTLNALGNPTFLGMRQKEFACTAECSINGESMLNGQEAGMTVYMNEKSHYDLAVSKEEEGYRIMLKLHIGGLQLVVGEIRISNPDIMIKIVSKPEYYTFYVQDGEGKYCVLGGAESKYLSSEVAEGFTGVIIAAYCIADVAGESGWVEFHAN
jgi:alpha-N-arabinofuranosidase